MIERALPLLLLAQGIMGAIDTLLNHELLEDLPHRPSARPELPLHVAREAIYATLFVGLAWFEWHGAAAALLGALLAAEALVTVGDELVENRTRVLPQNERVLHVFLTLNYGIILALLVPQLLEWGARPTALAPIHHGWISWALSLFGLASAAWSLRDLLAYRRLRA